MYAVIVSWYMAFSEVSYCHLTQLILKDGRAVFMHDIHWTATHASFAERGYLME